MRLPASARAATAILLVSLAARASSPEMVRAFEEGRALAKQGQYDAAAEKFLESIAIEPSVGALLNLADCYQRQGKSTLAVTRFHEAAKLADAIGDPRANEARKRAAKAESLLAWIVLGPTRAGDTPRVTIDDRPAAPVDGKIVVDPGTHVVVVAWARGEQRRTTLALRPGESTIVDLSPAPEPLPRAHAAEQTRPPPAEPSTLRWVGIGGAAAGALAIGTGLIFGLVAKDRRDELIEACPTYPTCSESLRADLDPKVESATRSADIATVVVVSGVALAAAGIVLWIVAPRSAPRDVMALRF